MSDPTAIETAFRAREGRLRGLCYRMTGVAADADDLVQEAFVRAVTASSSLQRKDLERWLVRVATNLSLDCLRRRKRRRYPGSWLPSPVETAQTRKAGESAGASAPGAEQRIELAEQVSYALLVALEALGPRARAVLILVEVLDYSAAEVAGILETSEGNVRVLRHRARRALEAYDPDTTGFGASQQRQRGALDRQRDALERLVSCMMQQDAAGMAALLADDVRSITDGGGRYTALREPLAGKAAVVRFHLETARRRAPVSDSEIRLLNGAAALIVETRPLRPQMAPRLVLRCELDDDGLIREIQTILAPAKLTAVHQKGI